MIILRKILEEGKLTIHNVNKIAKPYGIKLKRGEGYFYWYSTNDDIAIILANLKTTSVWTSHLGDDIKFWTRELSDIVKQMKQEKKNARKFDKNVIRLR